MTFISVIRNVMVDNVRNVSSYIVRFQKAFMFLEQWVEADSVIRNTMRPIVYLRGPQWGKFRGKLPGFVEIVLFEVEQFQRILQTLIYLAFYIHHVPKSLSKHMNIIYMCII